VEFLNAIPMDTSQLFEIGLQWGGTLLSALAVLVFGMWVAKRLTQWATSLLHRKSMDEAAAGFVGQIAYAILVVMVLLTALDQLGVDTTSMIAALGAAGLAIGLALQSSLSNLASGFLLVTLRPFKKGDYVEAAGTSGSVDQITMLIQGMAARYKSASGGGPATQLQGQTVPGIAGFRSKGEIMEAMSDPRYESDSAYREDVTRKMSMTPDTVW